MAKQSNQVRREIQGEGRRINQDADRYNDLLFGGLSGAQGRGNQLYDDIYSGYQGILGGQGRSRPNFGQYENMFRGFADNPFKDIDVNRFRGGGVFDEFAKTGGLSDADTSNIRARGTRTIPAYFDSLRDEMGRRAQISGAGPSYSSSLARLARDQSRGAQNAASDVEYEIMDRRNRGRQWGAEGMHSSERALGEYGSANRRFGLEGALRAAGMGGDWDLRNSGMNMQALQGLQGLRGQIPAEQFALYDRILQNMGQRGGLAGNNIRQRADYDPNQSWFDRLMKIWGGVQEGASSYGSRMGI